MRSIGKELGATMRLINIYNNLILKDSNITSGMIPFIMELSRCDGITQDELSYKLMVDKTTTARMMKRLENLDFVKRQRDENDKRSIRLYLSSKCKAMIPNLTETLSNITGKLKKDISENDIENFFILLSKIQTNLKEEIEATNKE